MNYVGIVGGAADKFTPRTEVVSRGVIRGIILMNQPCVVVSGGCHLGGIDIWAEEEAKPLGAYNEDYIHLPKKLQWSGGYRERNLKIARDSVDGVHVIVAGEYPESYTGRRFKSCYHCQLSLVPWHVKSGACWTARKAMLVYRHPAWWHIVRENGVKHFRGP